MPRSSPPSRQNRLAPAPAPISTSSPRRRATGIEGRRRRRRARRSSSSIPAEPPLIMRDTVFTPVAGGSRRHRGRDRAMVADVQKYVPGYRLKQKVQFERIGQQPGAHPRHRRRLEGIKTSVFLEVEGAAHYLPAYAGNLDIMTSAAKVTADHSGRPQRPRRPHNGPTQPRQALHSGRHPARRHARHPSPVQPRTLAARSPARSTAAGVDAIEIAHGDGLQGSAASTTALAPTPTGSGSRRWPTR
jgi:hypothetical protein